MEYKCEIVEREAQPALSIRTTTSVQNMPQTLGEKWGKIMHYLEDIGEKITGAPYVGYFNMDMQNLDIEIAVPVSKKLLESGEIKPSEIPKGKYAITLHIGPYDQVEPAYNILTKFIQEKGQEPTWIAYEIYLNDPAEVKPEELQTQILFLLK